jgi:hypothetical protein
MQCRRTTCGTCSVLHADGKSGQPGLQVGRVYRVWLRTPETAERDREILRRDLKWAAFTGGMFSRDAEVLRDAALREPELLREVQSELRRTSIGPDSR